MSRAGTGGSSLPNIDAEFSVLIMVVVCINGKARDPNSANSQFFICFNISFLDGQYSVWGQVVEGMEFVALKEENTNNLIK